MSDVRDLLESLDMESWADYEGIRFKLTRGTRGTQLNIRECPCCGNTKWKTYLNAETGLGNCFVCEEKFTKWKFISAHLNLSGKDTFNHIENYSKTQGWKPSAVAEEKKESKLSLPESVPLPLDGRNLRYLIDRNITSDLAKQFSLRYSAAGRFNFIDPYGKQSFQDYSKRVIIPVFDLDNKLVTFQGRDVTGLADKKYLFPPGFASTGSVIYNGNVVKSKRPKRIVVSEGVFDAIAIKAAIQFDPVLFTIVSVASFGKKLGDDQIEILKYFKRECGLEEIIFMWDSEVEATKAAIEAAMKCRSVGIECRLAVLPSGCDPNEVEPAEVCKAIWKAVLVDPMTAIRLKLSARNI